MVRVGVSVEGLTEERFVKEVLAPTFSDRQIYLTPVDIQGNVNIQRVKKELSKLVYSFDYVTTLYDFYGFKDRPPSDDRNALERRIKDTLDPSISHRVFPYVQMYEFEGLLFSSPAAIANHVSSRSTDNDVHSWASSVLQSFNSKPELINDSPVTAPSKRLISYTDYKKTIDGPNIAKEIGLQGLRANCPNFDGWISHIESLS